MISLREIVATCFPDETELRGAESTLDREVTWATRPRPSPPAFGHLSGGELVLIRLDELADVDDRLTLDGAIRQLAGFGVSAVAVAGPISAANQALATTRNVALLEVPRTADLGEIERHASHLIAERRRDRQRRGHEASRKLMELAIAGESLATIISSLNQLSRLVVALEGRDGRLLTYYALPSQPKREEVAPLLEGTREAARNWLSVTSDASAAEPPTMRLALGLALDRTLAPVIGRDGLLGCLSLIGPAGSWSSDDAMLASRGAAACAIVLAREYASIAARREIELNVLDEVLDGALRNETTLLQQARRLGHDFAEPHRLMVIDLNHEDPEILRPAISAALGQIDSQLLWRLADGTLEVVLSAEQDPEAVAHSLRGQVQSFGRSAGVGSMHPGLGGLQRSRHEARQALTIQSRLGIDSTVARFSDLGVYRLLFAAETLPEFDAFHSEILGPLIDHDRDHRADLVETLRAFFDANCSPKDAARRLGVHRNTVLYRLERVKVLTGYDLNDAETRLRLQLALYMNTIRSSRSARRSTVVAAGGNEVLV
jgi:PucR family transcriptional regulator, purine catabolism regulatory protein